MHRDTGFSTAFIGSSNLSRAAMLDGLEWNVRLAQTDNGAILEKFSATFEQYWSDSEFRPYDAAIYRTDNLGLVDQYGGASKVAEDLAEPSNGGNPEFVKVAPLPRFFAGRLIRNGLRPDGDRLDHLNGMSKQKHLVHLKVGRGNLPPIRGQLYSKLVENVLRNFYPLIPAINVSACDVINLHTLEVQVDKGLGGTFRANSSPPVIVALRRRVITASMPASSC